MSIEETTWAQHIKDKYPSIYDEAISIAQGISKDNPATIYHTDETGEWVWAVAVGDFWLECFSEKDDAVRLCKKMGWAYTFE